MNPAREPKSLVSKRALCAAVLALAGALWAPAAAQAAFGFEEVDAAFTKDKDGSAGMEAGSHPYAFTTTVEMETEINPKTGEPVPDGEVKDLRVELPPGFVGTPDPVPTCSSADFLNTSASNNACPDGTAVGIAELSVGFNKGEPIDLNVPVYNLEPPPGVAAKLGFTPFGVGVTLETNVAPAYPYNLVASTDNISQPLLFYGAEVTLWGVPADPAHNSQRGNCAFSGGGGNCKAELPEVPFFTLPRRCTEPLQVIFNAAPWHEPGAWVREVAETDDGSAPPNPRGVWKCEALGLDADISSSPTSDRAESPTGLDFDLAIRDEGLTSPTGTANSDIKKAVVTLPRGVTVNPSQAEGLAVCSRAQFAREEARSPFGAGCPGASKIGTVEVETPLLDGEILEGQLFVAEPYNNPFGSLIALYMTIKSPELGINVGLAGEVQPDPDTGQLITTFGGEGTDPLPQLPFSNFRLHFREGGRSPLITPNRCGTYETEAVFTPWANPDRPLNTTSSFQITAGVNGAPCPQGTPPFQPGFAAGTLNNAAGQHSPFLMRLTRRDGDQDMTRFDATLPPGAVAKLAGIPWCPDAAIARARGREGKDELRSPSCPLASQIGSVQGGAGVGSQLTYVPGKVYLAGPVGGAPLSVVGIVPAVAGPFDVGTIVVRQALDLDPISGQAKVLSAASDDLPHILAGIPLKVRDIQVSVDRPDFTLNPTNCNPMAVLAGIWGGGSHVFSAADDSPVLRQARFQAASCASLGFEPKLAIKLKGGVKRGAHPALRAHVVPRPGDANFSRAVVTLPTSAFLEQGHIRTICTRVQFAAPPGHGAHCPPGARYGFARAWSPLLDGPVTGPVFLRSSDNNLPDLVAALTGPPSARVQVELSARIDSVKGGIRSTFAGIPDVPVSRFILDMQGGKKGLIVNSRHLCHRPARNRAKSNLRGQNGRLSKTRPRVVATACQKRRKAKRKLRHNSAGR